MDATAATTRRTRQLLLIDREAFVRLMRPADYLAAVEAAFRAHARRRTSQPMPLRIEVDGGDFRDKGAFVALRERFRRRQGEQQLPGNAAKGRQRSRARAEKQIKSMSYI